MGKTSIQLGDIFEIKTQKGFGYLKYVKEPVDNSEVELIEVYYGVEKSPLLEFTKLINNQDFFYVQFPLLAALRRKIVRKVGSIPIDKEFEPPLFFRTEDIFQEDFWQIVNSKTWHRYSVKELTEEQRKLSPWGVWNDTLLIENLDNGWRLDTWV